MKNILLTYCALPLLLAPLAEAGINGTYKVRGSETEDGQKFAFTGSVTVSNYKAGKYALKFADGEGVTYKFSFSKPLQETTTTQTVNAFNSQGTSTATFSQKSGKFSVKFSYKSKDGSVRGSGTGSK